MASIPLTDPPNRADFFRQTALNNLRYWQAWLETHLNEAAALDRERNAVAKAISFALDLDPAWPVVFELVTIASPLMERRGHWDMWQWVLTRALKTARRMGDSPGEVTLSALLARLLFQQGHYKEAVDCYRRTLRMARQIGDPFNEARACTNLGYHYIEQGQWRRAEILCSHALCLFEEIGSDHGRAHTENHLGILYTRQGRWAEAEQYLERACAIWQTMGDEHGLMRGFVNLCLLYNSMNLPDRAILMAEKSFHQAKLTGEELETGRIHLNIGTAYKIKGKLAEAEIYTRQAEEIFQRLSNIHGLTNVLNNLGEIFLLRQEWNLATTHLMEALPGYRHLNNKHGEIQTIIHLAKSELLQGHSLPAQAWLEEAERQLKQHPQAGRYNQLPEQIKVIRRSLAEKTLSNCDVTPKSV